MTASAFPALGLEVPVGEIEKELKKLWEADEANTNASLMNLAIYSENPESLSANSDIIRELTREHACRAILIGMDRESEKREIHSWITAHCHLQHGKKSVCCEQLAFLLRGYALGRMRNTVFAHLASDLPLLFWWQGELSPIFEASLYRNIDRFVYDSSSWSDLSASYQEIKGAVEETDGRLVVQDLAWTRTYHFRIALAALFDDLVAQRSLEEVTDLLVVAQSQHRVSSLLLVSWIVTQAGWTLVGDFREGEDKLSAETKEGKRVSISLEWDDEGAPVGLCRWTAPECTVEVSHESGAKQLRQRLLSSEHTIDRSGPADGIEAAELVEDQLTRGGKNSLFRKVWPVFFALLGH